MPLAELLVLQMAAVHGEPWGQERLPLGWVPRPYLGVLPVARDLSSHLSSPPLLCFLMCN